MNKTSFSTLVLIATLAAGPVLADESGLGQRVENRFDRTGDRVDNRLDRKGNRIDNRLDRKGDRIDNRLDRKGDRIDRRLDRKGEVAHRRIDRHQPANIGQRATNQYRWGGPQNRAQHQFRTQRAGAGNAGGARFGGRR